MYDGIRHGRSVDVDVDPSDRRTYLVKFGSELFHSGQEQNDGHPQEPGRVDDFFEQIEVFGQSRLRVVRNVRQGQFICCVLWAHTHIPAASCGKSQVHRSPRAKRRT